MQCGGNLTSVCATNSRENSNTSTLDAVDVCCRQQEYILQKGTASNNFIRRQILTSSSTMRKAGSSCAGWKSNPTTLNFLFSIAKQQLIMAHCRSTVTFRVRLQEVPVFQRVTISSELAREEKARGAHHRLQTVRQEVQHSIPATSARANQPSEGELLVLSIENAKPV